MNRVDRLFGILTLLQSKKYNSAESIAERFEISVRTVYRDIKALDESGIPITFEPGKGYCIVPGFFLPPIAFTEEEAYALLLMEAAAAGFSDNSIKKHYGNAIFKIRAVLKHSQKERASHLSEHIHVQIPKCLVNEFEYLSPLQDAIVTKRCVKISYLNKKEERSTRTIEPLGLIYYAMAWHIIGYCTQRNDYRDFKLNRIQRLTLLDEFFLGENRMSFTEYMKEHIPVDY